MRAAALFLCGCAVAASAAEPFKLAAPGLQCVKMAQDSATFFNDHVTQRLIERGLRVYTQREIQTAIGMERQKQLLGCAAEDSSCLAELAGALGVDAILFGNVGQFGKTFQVNIKVLQANNLAPLATFSAHVDSEEGLLTELTRGADQIAVQLQNGQPERVKLKDADAEVVSSSGGGKKSRVLSWVMLGGGVAVGGAGLALLIVTLGRANEIRNAPSSAEALALRNGAIPLEAAGWICAGLGVAALATGIVTLLTGGSTSGSASLMVTPHGASFGFSGVWP
jgi:hypothetical protein